MRGIVIGALMLAVAGCGGTATHSSATEPVARADRYQQLVEPLNCEAARTNQMSSSGAGWADLKAAAQRMAAAETKFVADLQHQNWTPEVSGSIGALADATKAQAAQWATIGAATSEQQFTTAVGKLDMDKAAEAAKAVRAQLGLSTDEGDALCPGHGG